MRYINRELDEDGDGWPEGLGNVERTGMGPEKLDNTVYYIRGLYDLADMARSKGDAAHAQLGRGTGRAGCRQRFEAGMVDGGPEHARRLARARRARRSSRSTGSRVTPMEAELTVGRSPGARAWRPSTTARARSRCTRRTASAASSPSTPASSTPAAAAGLWATASATIFGLNTAIQSVGEGNYGRLAGQHSATRAPRSSRCSPSLRPAGCPTSSPARCRRSCRRRDVRQEHRPLLDLPRDVHAGVGPLRQRLARCAPAARRAAGPRPRQAQGRSPGAVR